MGFWKDLLESGRQKPKATMELRDKISRARVQELHPAVRDTFRDFITEAETTLDITLRVVQGLRTFATQQALVNQPFDKKDNDGDGRVDEADEKVTNAKPGASYHQYGLAVDLVQMLNGKPVWNQTPYAKISTIATKYGIRWGGHWNDMPHFERNLGFNWRTLLAKYKAKEFIAGTTYVKLSA